MLRMDKQNLIIKKLALIRLYKILLKYWEEIKEESDTMGLCNAVKDLFKHDIFTAKEREQLDTDLFENKPNKNRYHLFLFQSSWKGEGYWFTLTKEGNYQRSEYIKQRILDLTEQLNTIQNEK